jgi:F-type H+-transporting ATPase subunit b
MGGFASLGINLPLLVVFIINFIVLFFLLRIFLYKPVLKMLDERTKRTKEGMELAEATKKEYEQARVEVQKQIDRGRQEAQALIAQALQTGEKLKEESRGSRSRPRASLKEPAGSWDPNGTRSSKTCATSLWILPSRRRKK